MFLTTQVGPILNVSHVLCGAVLSRSVVSDSLYPMDCRPPDSSVHGDSLGKNTGAGCHALLQGIFPTQGLNPGLPHCRWILYHLSHQGSPCVCANIFERICVLCVWMFVSVYMCICEWVCMFYMYACMRVSM